jgi:uncharacterized protein (TIGR02145 family)
LDGGKWTALTDYVGSSAGKKLKARSGWPNNGNGTDDYGFAALPGKCISCGGFPDGTWWSATDYPPPNPNGLAYGRRMYYFNETVERFLSGIKTDSFSVRCVKD